MSNLNSNIVFNCRCTDINPYAADISRRTGQQNGVSVDPVVTDLVSLNPFNTE